MSSSHYNHPNGVDVEIDQDFSFDLETNKTLDVETSSKNELDYDIDVDAKDAKVKVEIDIDKEESTKSETIVKYDEQVKQDIDIDIDENVDKNVNIDVWDMEVNVKAENIEYGVLHDEDTNDIDSARLLDVGPGATLNMNDFTARQLAAGNSFNGAGNDSLFSARQSNSMVDNDNLTNPVVAYGGLLHEPSLRPDPGHDDGPKGGAPFQNVDADGGHAKADDGIDGNIENSANGNAGTGSVAGSAAATADAAANVAAFTQDIVMGGNTQGNFVNLNVTGGNLTQANDIDAKGGGDWGGDHDPKSASSPSNGDHADDGGTAYRDVTFDDDVNDLDSSELLNVEGATLSMDDFTFDTTAIGDSFNGAGNDMAFDVGQVNDLVDNDVLCNPQVTYQGSGGPLQDVSVTGGWASSGDGISGNIKGVGNYNGADGSISGSTSASADAVANVSAFTQNIVMGANLQVNNFTATVVGGDSVGADDITGI